MVDHSQLTLDRLFESVLQVCRTSHLQKSLFGPVAFADLPRMSRLYGTVNRDFSQEIKPGCLTETGHLIFKLTTF